ncbi:hypothetical protein ACRWQM_17780 [Shewanella sp. HL-SH5]|uniref:hypothetical protein n=1 Tax=Shewanella sp. HL-SH5 TaxID=3436241 RepID=UPI003EBB844E
MPLKLDLNHIDESISLDECYEQLIESKFDSSDDESFQTVAPILKKLNNNKKFLPEILMTELEKHCDIQKKTNKYTPQVIMLKPAQKGINFFMRANIWLAKKDPLLQTSGEKSFFYNVPHDHNFSFLTSGYTGPGYGSDYYEYDYYDVVGYPGEKVDLRFIERKNLTEGEVMLYRAYKDVHNQLPAEELSVSLNIMPSTMFAHLRPQYVFDENCSKIVSSTVTSNSSMEPILHLIAEMGSDDSREFIERFANTSCIEEDRFKAIKALVSAEKEVNKKSKIIEELGIKSNSKLVSQLSRNYLSTLALA